MPPADAASSSDSSSSVARRRRTGEVSKTEKQDELSSLQQEVAALEEALKAKDRRIMAMKEIGRSLGGNLDLDGVLGVIMEHVTGLLDADRSTLYLLDHEKKELWSKIVQGDGVQDIRMPLGVGVAGWVAKAGQPLNLRDAYADRRFNPAVDKRTGYRSQNMLAYPMRDHRGRVLGVIQALNKNGPGGFTEEDERTLEAIASQASQAIENAILYKEALRQNDELQNTKDQLSRKLAEQDLLFDFSQSIARAPDQNEIIRLGLERSCGLMGAESAALLWMDGPRNTLHQLVRLTPSGKPQLRQLPADPNEGIVGWAASHAQPVIVADASKDKRHSKTLSRKLEINPRNLCAVPMLTSDGACSGALVLMNRAEGFIEEHVVLLTMLANHVAKALEAARSKEQDEKERRLQTIGQMLSGVVHDFKTPMTIISGYVQLMSKSESQAEREEFAETVLKQFDNISQMTKDLLQFARGEVEVLLRKVSLPQFMSDATEILTTLFKDTGVDVTVESKFRGSLRMDPVKMMRVVNNIARNAKEAMQDGGKFTFRVQQAGESVIFQFSDSGPGIAEELEGRLFTEFATHGKADGTGLGLAVVRRIVQEHHGDISYESRRGKGTTFMVRIPL